MPWPDEMEGPGYEARVDAAWDYASEAEQELMLRGVRRQPWERTDAELEAVNAAELRMREQEAKR